MISKTRALEEYLVTEARAGDRRALADLVRLRGPRLLVHATRLLEDRDAARDAVQEAWVEIVRGLPRLRDAAAFPVWATRIVSRRCAATIRTRQKGRAIVEGLRPLTPDLADDPAEAGDTNRALHRAIAALPAEQAATIALFYLEDMRLAEVATALDIPLGTVKSRLSNARAALRTILEGD